MLIGKLPNARTWTSYDKQRNNGDLARYGKDDKFQVVYAYFLNKLVYSERLELNCVNSWKNSNH